MDENNVFNSFSFKKWAKYVREQRMEEEIRRQRMEQVIRLRNKLIRERALRDQVDLLTDEDVDKLVHYMNSAGKSFAGIATGIQSTVRFGKRQSTASPGKTPIPTISGTIRPPAGPESQSGPSSSKSPQSVWQRVGVGKAQSGREEEEGEGQVPLELSEKIPLEQPRDGDYLFGEIPILAPLHPHRVPGESGQQRQGFQHNVRYGAPARNSSSSTFGQFTAITGPMQRQFQQQGGGRGQQ